MEICLQVSSEWAFENVAVDRIWDVYCEAVREVTYKFNICL